jgi:ATP-dependent helicase/nuclease subunit B
VRPRRLSVTRVETWMRDPYQIYARYILGLQALEPIEADPGVAERGRFIHQAIDEFLKECRDGLPADALARLIEHGRRAFAPVLARPGVWAFWWPRFERIARWFVGAEQGRHGAIALSRTETKGELLLDGPAGPFRLTATADRIDRLNDGRLVVIDYKTGQLPSAREVAEGYAPQLPLEALIAEAGGFAEIRPHASPNWRSGACPAASPRARSAMPRRTIRPSS